MKDKSKQGNLVKEPVINRVGGCSAEIPVRWCRYRKESETQFPVGDKQIGHVLVMPE